MITLDGVSFSYPDMAMRFDLQVRPREFLGVIGPSGAGKSTLLALIAGFEKPRAGNIYIAGENMAGMPPAARPSSSIFQEHNSFAHLTVWQNVALGVSPDLRLNGTERGQVDEALTRTGLQALAQRPAHALSGGERQRIAIARALVRSKPVLLLDEPFTALGPALRAEMLQLVRGLQAERHLTVLMVTHQPEDIANVADRIAFVEQGRIAHVSDTSAFFAASAPAEIRAYLKS